MKPELGYIFALAAMTIWGVIVIPIKKTTTPGRLGIAISMLAGVSVLVVAALCAGPGRMAASAVRPSTLILLLLAGVFQFPLATVCYYECIRLAELSTVTPLTRLKTAVVVALVALLGIEGITLRIVIACAVGVLGAVILTRQSDARRDVNAADRRKGIAFALLACCSWAMGDILIRPVLRSVPALAATLLSLCMGALVYCLFLVCRRQMSDALRMPLRDKLLYAAHGVFSFGLAYLAFFSSIRSIGVAKAGIITAAWPAISFVAGVTLYRERISFAKIIGFVLLMGSVLLTVSR